MIKLCLKILGFMFGNIPSVKQHIDYMLLKAKKKLWSLRHVKKSRMKEEEMFSKFILFDMTSNGLTEI